jgi:nuclear cap-binding protein subunit 2
MEVEPEFTMAQAERPKMVLPPPLRASELLQPPGSDKKLYWDRSHYESPDSQMIALTKSSCLYVGNLSFTCRTVHVRDHFEQLGPVKRVIMGLDRNKRTPCGFCFVEYYDRRIALQAVSLLTGTKLDGNIIRVELDAGFIAGREFGRGVHGGQVRDDRRDRKRQRSGGLYANQNNSTAGGGGGGGEVKLDAALPSAREVSGHYGPSSYEAGASAVPQTDVRDVNMMDQEEDNNAEPDTKRTKTEE